VNSDSRSVNVNMASAQVLAALPAIRQELAASIVAERDQKPFADSKDLLARIPELNNSPALDYLAAEIGSPTVLVATAVIRPSATSKTVRLHFKRERQKKILIFEPLIYKDIEVLKFANWEY